MQASSYGLASSVLGTVGKSGSGKTTVAQAIVGVVLRDRSGLRLQDEGLAPDGTHVIYCQIPLDEQARLVGDRGAPRS